MLESIINIRYTKGIKMRKSLKSIICILMLIFGTYTNASIIRIINGTETAWLELAETAGLSRTEIEASLADTNSNLYGYRYATRLETQMLLESYNPNPSELNHWYSYMATGAQEFFDEFGALYYDDFDGDYTTTSSTIYNVTTADGVQISYNLGINSYFFYGSSDECGASVSCVGRMYGLALDGVMQAQLTPAVRGFDAYELNPHTLPSDSSEWIRGSLLVADTSFAPVPAPAALWLFGSGLLGLIGVAKRKASYLN